VGPKTGLDEVEKRKFLTIPGLELRPLGRPARSQSLYRLRYPGFAFFLWNSNNNTQRTWKWLLKQLSLELINYHVSIPSASKNMQDLDKRRGVRR
jgi:hypothetical protein